MVVYSPFIIVERPTLFGYTGNSLSCHTLVMTRMHVIKYGIPFFLPRIVIQCMTDVVVGFVFKRPFTSIELLFSSGVYF